MNSNWRWAAYPVMLGALGALGCSSSATSDESTGGSGSVNDARLFRATAALEVPVPAQGRSYVTLHDASTITPRVDDPEPSTWDLAFEGYDVFTNSGASGSGKGGSFGQLDITSFLDDSAPEVPFVSADKTGGAFLDWYAYDSAAHALYSRFHVYGLRRGDRLWKVQILRYYGERDNAAVSALYSVRYAELGSAADTQTVAVDGTAGGIGAGANAASGCLDLETGNVLQLTESEAQRSSDWDLCFRRDAISVNGQAGGPRGDTALDLQAGETSSETLAAVQKETADSVQPRFDQTTASDFDGGRFRGDHVVSGFETGAWLDDSSEPPTPVRAAWLVNDQAGAEQFLIAFTAFDEATTSSPGTLVMRIKPMAK